jgi:hypothetical protein
MAIMAPSPLMWVRMVAHQTQNERQDALEGQLSHGVNRSRVRLSSFAGGAQVTERWRKVDHLVIPQRHGGSLLATGAWNVTRRAAGPLPSSRYSPGTLFFSGLRCRTEAVLNVRGDQAHPIIRVARAHHGKSLKDLLTSSV